MDLATPSQKLKLLIGGATVIIWDFDGTLVDLQVEWETLKREAFDRFFPEKNEMISLPSLTQIEERAQSLGQRPKYIEMIRAYESDVLYTPIVRSMNFVRDYGRSYTMLLWSDNLRQTITSILTAEHVVHLFSQIVAKDDVSRSKPHSDELDAILSSLEVPKESIVYFGDSWKDEESAKSLGVRFINTLHI